MRLGPVEFGAGLQALDDTDRDYLSKVAGILHDRPKVSVKLCAFSVIDDLVVFQSDRGRHLLQNDQIVDIGYGITDDSL